MSAVERVRPGTAEQLARLAHFRALEHTQPEELDIVATFLIAAPGHSMQLWDELRDNECAALWHLITDDWDSGDLDDMTEAEGDLPYKFGEEARYARTLNRLVCEIEQAVWVARYKAAEERRGTVGDATVQTLLGRR